MLLQYLTLDRATSREVAFLLYPDISLDQFPRSCTCEVCIPALLS